MWRMIGYAVRFGALGFVLTPFAVFFGGLFLAYALDDRCGTPGDSGGCEMGVASLAMASSVVGLALGIAVGIMLARRRPAVRSGADRPPSAGA